MTMADKSASGSAPAVHAELVDAAALCSIDELSVACNVDPDWIAELVEHGVIEPIGRGRSDWKFTSLTIVRAAKARRLERDLNLDLPGLAVVLDLLDQIDDLRVQLKKHQSTVK
jgi:chaperone modulatory protein CbpM